MMSTRRMCLWSAVMVFIAVQAGAADCAELKIFGSRVTRMMIDDIGAQFERETSFKPVVVTDVAAVMKRRIEAGEPFDLAILVNFQTDDLIKSGKLLTGPVGIRAIKSKGMDPG